MMNKAQLLIMGAYAQTRFDLKPNFEVVEIPVDGEDLQRLVKPRLIVRDLYAPLPEVDVVKMKHFAFGSNGFATGQVRMAYSERLNILVFAEVT